MEQYLHIANIVSSWGLIISLLVATMMFVKLGTTKAPKWAFRGIVALLVSSIAFAFCGTYSWHKPVLTGIGVLLAIVMAIVWAAGLYLERHHRYQS